MSLVGVRDYTTEKQRQICLELIQAINDKIFEEVKELIQSLKENGGYVNPHGESLLHIAADKAYLPLVKYLVLEEGMDVNYQPTNLVSPLMCAAREPNGLPVVEFLLEQGANPQLLDGINQTIFHYAVFSDSFHLIRTIYEHCNSQGIPINLDAQDIHLITPLHRAVRAAALKSVGFLINQGVNMNLENKEMNRPIDWACLQIVRTKNYLEDKEKSIQLRDTEIKALEAEIEDLEIKLEKQKNPIFWQWILSWFMTGYLLSEREIQELLNTKSKYEKQIAFKGGQIATYQHMIQEKSLKLVDSELILSRLLSSGAEVVRHQRDDDPRNVNDRRKEQKEQLEKWASQRNIEKQNLDARYLQERSSLKDALKRSVIEPNIIARSKEIINTLLASKSRHSIPPKIHGMIANLLSVAQPSPLMLVKTYKLLPSKEITRYHSSFYNINSAIQQVEKILELLTQHPPDKDISQLVTSLSRIRLEYRDFIEKIMHAPRTKDPLPSQKILEEYISLPIEVLSQDLPPSFLSYQAVRTLINEASVKENETGRNIVKYFEKVFFKYNELSGNADPVDVGVDCMIQGLSTLTKGNVSSPTELIQFKGSDVNYICLASKAVSGEGMHTIMNHNPGVMNSVRLESFSAQIITSLLTNPTDAKPDNFMINDELCIVCIDNDNAMVPSITYDNNVWVLNLKNVLYFLPQMNSQVDPIFVGKFLSQAPEVIISRWLHYLYHKNIYFESESFKSQCGPKVLKQIGLPIHFFPRTVESVYKRICLIQKILNENPEITHDQLFSKIDPVAHACYQCLHLGDPIFSLEPLYSTRIPKVTEILSKEELERVQPFLNDIRVSRPFKDLRDQTLSEAATEFTKAIDLSKMSSSDEELMILREIGDLVFAEKVYINNDSCLDWENLNHILVRKLPQLKEIHISGSRSLTAKDLAVGTEGKKSLTISIDVNCRRISREGWKYLWLERMRRIKNDEYLLVKIYVDKHEFSLADPPTDLYQKAIRICPEQEELLRFFIENGARV